MQGRPQPAADRFQVALALIPHDPPGDASAAAHRSILLFDLARARAGAGNMRGTLDALVEHVTAIRQVRAGLRASDPYVLAAFDQLIDEREAMAARLKAWIEARPPP